MVQERIKTLWLDTSASPKANGDEKVDLESQLGKISSKLEGSDGLIQYPIKKTREKMPNNGNIELKSQICTERDQETPMGYYSLHPLPPPLPKSISESWLKRALLAVSSKHTSLRSSPGKNKRITHKHIKGLSIIFLLHMNLKPHFNFLQFINNKHRNRI